MPWDNALKSVFETDWDTFKGKLTKGSLQSASKGDVDSLVEETSALWGTLADHIGSVPPDEAVKQDEGESQKEQDNGALDEVTICVTSFKSCPNSRLEHSAVPAVDYAEGHTLSYKPLGVCIASLHP